MVKYFQFEFEFIFTAKDLELFKNEEAHTSFGYRWKYYSDEHIEIIRSGIGYTLYLHHDTCKHEALFYSRDPETDLEDVVYSFKPKRLLLRILQKWTCHKPKLEMIDVHSHLNYAIDDGSKNLQMSLDMVKSSYEQGARGIICTSHYGWKIEDYLAHFHMLRKEVQKLQIPVQLYTGYEVACNEKFYNDILSDLEKQLIVPMANSTYTLLEFAPNVSGRELLRCVKNISELAGIQKFSVNRVVIAHVERCKNLRNDESALRLLRQWRIPLQINLYSLTNEPDEEIRGFARELLEHQLVSFVGSDAHQMNYRPPYIAEAVKYIYDNCEVRYANAICFENAEMMLLDERIIDFSDS